MSEDRTALVELLAVFAAATDARDWDTITSLLTEDCVAYGARGPQAVVRRMQDHLGGVGPTQHLLGNHRVTVTGDEARALTYGRVHHVGAGPMADSFYECLGEYDDRWVRTAAGWRLTRRGFEIRISLGDPAVLRPA
ncbi:nuclear transport factor 2 family protein [Nocardioides sp. W7]|uniref:nuclear transport factor 2 family protein n=1 Tax=Nocardioides sp. W7 TaxID=2931390 RepID=UPI001FD3A51B|nr:nuclear transport factor 2 family protein [Nocardioides sp. W7]